MTCERTLVTVIGVIDDFLKRNSLKSENCAWALRESPLGGIGVFATRNIAVGEEIFNDFPVIDGPRTKSINSLFCVVCYKTDKVELCRTKCGLPICSNICWQRHQTECELITKKRGNVEEIDSELFKNVTPIRCLSLSNSDKTVVAQLKHHEGSNHGIEVDKLGDLGVAFEKEEEDYIRFVCCVMDANAFEVSMEGSTSNFRGLYPLAGLVNHSCVPNLTHAFDQNKIMDVRSCVPIKEGQELFHSYVRLIWSTPTRQFNLKKTKHFTCNCPRCLDPTEFGTYMSAILCKMCKGNVLPKNPLGMKTRWACEDCQTEVSKQEVANLMCVLGSILQSFEDEDLKVMLKFLNLKLSALVHPNHEIAVDLKYRIVWIIGHQEKYKLNDIDTHLLELKLKLCKDLLKLLRNLKIGDSKMKELLSYEMLLCLKEKYRRSMITGTDDSIEIPTRQEEDYLKIACSLLKEDVTFPEEVII